MKITLRINMVILLVIGVLSLCGEVRSCELNDLQVTWSGEYMHEVLDSDGNVIGVVHLRRSDGKWEALLFGEGALNELFVEAQEAAKAVCISANE